MISVLKEKCCSLELSIYERVLGGKIIMLTKILSSTTVFRISWALCINFFIVIIFHSITFMSDQANKNTYKTALVNIRDSFQKHFKNLTWNNLTKIWNWKYETDWKTVLVHRCAIWSSDHLWLCIARLTSSAEASGLNRRRLSISKALWGGMVCSLCWVLLKSQLSRLAEPQSKIIGRLFSLQ